MSVISSCCAGFKTGRRWKNSRPWAKGEDHNHSPLSGKFKLLDICISSFALRIICQSHYLGDIFFPLFLLFSKFHSNGWFSWLSNGCAARLSFFDNWKKLNIPGLELPAKARSRCRRRTARPLWEFCCRPRLWLRRRHRPALQEHVGQWRPSNFGGQRRDE